MENKPIQNQNRTSYHSNIKLSAQLDLFPDSIILEQVEKVFDLSRFVLKNCFNFNPSKIESVTIIQCDFS